MRRSEKECTDQTLMEQFLNEAQILHLAISVQTDAPYIVPLNFVYDGAFYVHSAVEGKKVTLLKRNPVVGFSVSEQLRILVSETNPCATGTSYRSVVGKAKVLFLEDAEEKSRILNMLMSKYTNSPPFKYKEKALSKLLIIKLKAYEMTYKIDLR